MEIALPNKTDSVHDESKLILSLKKDLLSFVEFISTISLN